MRLLKRVAKLMKDHKLAFIEECYLHLPSLLLACLKARWRKYPQDGGVCILYILIVSKGSPIFYLISEVYMY